MFELHFFTSPDRITDATTGEIATRLPGMSQTQNVTVQFSKPPAADALEVVEQCAKDGALDFTLRFYSHFPQEYLNTNILRKTPSVRKIALDYFQVIEGFEALVERPPMTALCLGAYKTCPRELLRQLDGSQMTNLQISGIEKPKMDLAPLSTFHRLTRLSVGKHVDGFKAISDIPNLSYLSVSPNRKGNYATLNTAPALEDLQFLLGGADDFNHVAHERLKKLSVIRVRGLSDLGDLARFPNLTELHVEDQIGLREIKFSELNKSLRKILIHNCKSLELLAGLEHLTHLEGISIVRTALDLDTLERVNFSKTLKILTLWSGRRREDDARDARLKARGLQKTPFWQL
ncbi:hypothetical protein [Celeribacter sp.]|uniref:hypothetical protein n=1 Tax=Celeribacter sp. TaxID=1890673 RepID=UPI003A8FBBB0